MIKLSEISAETLVSYEDSHYTITAEELREAVRNGEYNQEPRQWYTVIEKTWKADAKAMIERHIEDCYDEMYEDWDERALDELSKIENAEIISNIQSQLDTLFKSNYVSKYWTTDKQIDMEELKS